MADPKTYTQEEVDAMLTDKLAAAKAEGDTAFKKLWAEAKDAKAKLKDYEGVDPSEFKRLRDAAEEAERRKAAAEGDFKQLESQLVKKYEGELEKERGVSTRYRQSVEKNLIDAAAVAELAKHSDSPKLLLPHVRSRMKVIEQDGEFHARIVDDAGNVRIGKGQGSTPMSLSEFVEEMKQDKDYAQAFRGTGSSGGGAAKPNGGAGGGTKTIASTNSPEFLASLKDVAAGAATVAS